MKKRISYALYKDRIISKKEIEIVDFGIESMAGTFLSLFVTLIIGLYFDLAAEGAMFYFFSLPLRKNAGGYHAETKGRCCIFSISVTFLIFSFFSNGNITINYCIIVSVILIGIIFLLAPVENPKKHLDMVEQKVYRKRTRTILAIEGIMLLIGYLNDWEKLIFAICMNFTLCSLNLILGMAKNKIFKKCYVNQKEYIL